MDYFPSVLSSVCKEIERVVHERILKASPGLLTMASIGVPGYLN